MATDDPSSVENFRKRVEQGYEGVNPRDQTLARSTGQRARQIGQDNLENRMADNADREVDDLRDAEQTAAAQAREAAAMATAQAKAAKAEQARRVRVAEAAGAEITTDVETGTRDIARHPDGGVKFTPGTVGPVVPGAFESRTAIDDQVIPARNPLMPDDGAAGTTGAALTTQPGQVRRNDRGQTKMVPVEPTTDPKTGDQYVESKDSFGQTVRTKVGSDQKIKQLLQLERESAEVDLRQNGIAQARLQLDPRFEPVKAEYFKAKSDLEGIPQNFQQNDKGKWVRISESGLVSPADPMALEDWKKRRAEAQKRHDQAKRAYDAEAPKMEALTKAERAAKESALDIAARKLRIENDLPADDFGLSADLAEFETGQKSDATEAAEAATVPLEAPLNVADDEALKIALKGLPNLDQLTVEGTDVGYSRIRQDGLTVATLDSRGDTTVLIASPEATDIQAIIATSPDQRIPIYAADHPERMPYGEEAALAAKALAIARAPAPVPSLMGGDDGGAAGAQTTMVAGDDGKNQLVDFGSALQDREQAIRDMGLDRRELYRKAKAGIISTRVAENLLQNLYGETLVAADPKAEPTFQAWLAGQKQETKLEWARAAKNKDVDGRNAVWGDYVSDWYRENQHKPGVTFDMQRQARGVGPDKTVSQIAEGMAKGVGGIAVDAAGSMAGMAAGLAAMGVLSIAQGFSDQADELLDTQQDVLGRGWENFNRGIAANFKKYATGEGKKRAGQLSSSSWELKHLIENRHQIPPEDFRQQLIEAAAAVSRDTFSLHQLNLEDGWAVEPSDFDITTDQALGGALLAYAETGDPAMWEAFQRRLLLDKGQRQAEETMTEVTAGKSRLAAAFSGGVNAPPQETLIELASTALTLGTAKLLTTGAKAGVRAANAGAGSGMRMARLRAAAHQFKDDFRNFGRFSDTLAKPAGAVKRGLNKATTVAKVQIVEGAGEAVEEGIAGLAEPGATIESVAKQAGVGFIGGIILGPIVGAPMAARNSYRQRGERQKQVKDFADWYNRSQADTEGFVPLTPQEAEAALGMLDPARHSALVTEYQSAQSDFLAANDRMATDPAVPFALRPGERAKVEADAAALERQIQEDDTRDQTGKPAMTPAAREQAEEQLAELNSRLADSTAGEAPISQYSRALARLVTAKNSVSNYVGGVIEAAQSTKGMDPQERARTLGLTKVATGRTDLLTGAERKAIAGMTTREGLPYFATVQGRDVFTAEGRAELLADNPLVGGLVQTDESRAIFEQATAAAAGPDPTQPAGDQPEATGTRPNNTGGNQANAQRQPVTDVQLRQAREIAERVKAKALAAIPGIHDRIEITDQTMQQRTGAAEDFLTGGAEARTDDKILITVPDIAQEVIALGDPALVERQLLQTVLDHEFVHIVQFKVILADARAKGDTRARETVIADAYAKLHAEIKAANPEALAKARTLYGKASWDALGADWMRAAEMVRMLVEAQLRGETTDLHRALGKNPPAGLLQLLKDAIAYLTDLLKTGKLPESARSHVNAITDLYNQLAAAGQTRQPAADVQPATPGNDRSGPGPAARSSGTPDQPGRNEAPGRRDAGGASPQRQVTGSGIANGTRVETEWVLIPRDELKAAVNLGMNEDQNRQRSGNIGSSEQVQQIRNNPDPLYLTESPTARMGAPILDVREDGTLSVVAGNGRALGLILALEADNPGAKTLRDAYRARAESYGLDYDAAGKDPVLVRRVVGEYQGGTRRDFVEESNSSSDIKALSPAEQAKADLDTLRDTIQNLQTDEFTATGDLSAPTARLIASKLELPATLDGTPDVATATRRFNAALLAYMAERAGVSFRTLAPIIEGGKGKRVTSAIFNHAGPLAALDPDLGMAEHLFYALAHYQTAAREIEAMNGKSGTKGRDWAGSGMLALDGQTPLTPEARIFLSAMVKTNDDASAAALNQLLDSYLEGATAEQRQRQEERDTVSMFDPREEVPAFTFLRDAFLAQPQLGPYFSGTLPKTGSPRTAPAPDPAPEPASSKKAPKTENAPPAAPPAREPDKTAAQSAPVNPRVTELATADPDDMLQTAPPLDLAPLVAAQNHLPGLTKVRNTPLVRSLLGIAERIIPYFQGNKLKMTGPVASAAEQYWTPAQREAVTVLHDLFGGGGAWGLTLAELFPNLREIHINEFDGTRAAKIRAQIEAGDQFAALADSPVVRNALGAIIAAHRMRPSVQRKIDAAGGPSLIGSAMTAEEIAESNEAWSWGVINKTAAEYAKNLDPATQDAVIAVLKTMADDPERSGPWFKSNPDQAPTVDELVAWFKTRHAPKAAAIKARADALKARGVSFTFTTGDAYTLPIQPGPEVMVVADPPYFATTGYADNNQKSVVGADTYLRSESLMSERVAAGNNVIYTDEAWWLRKDIDRAVTRPDLVAGQKIAERIGNTLDFTVVADQIDSRYETLGIHNPAGSPVAPARLPGRSGDLRGRDERTGDDGGDRRGGGPAPVEVPAGTDGQAGVQPADPADSPASLTDPAQPAYEITDEELAEMSDWLGRQVSREEAQAIAAEAQRIADLEGQPENDEQGDDIVRRAASIVAARNDGGASLFSATSARAPFYSRLERAVESADFGTSKAKSPMQWQGVIEKWAGSRSSAGGFLWRKGISRDELKWSGIIPWLADQKRPLTKADVLGYLRNEGSVRLQEVSTAGIEDPRDVDILRAAGWTLERNPEDETTLAFQDPDSGDFVSASEMRGWMESEGIPAEVVEAAERIEAAAQGRTSTRYGQYQLPGGENYREVVLAMPKSSVDRSGYGLFVTAGPEAGQFIDDPDNNERMVFETAEDAQELADDMDNVEVRPLKQERPEYTSSHFPDVPNYVAHMRLNERTDSTGAPGLFIEELQSDRHQAGRKKGYQTDTPTAEDAIQTFGFSREQWDGFDAAMKASYLDELQEGGEHLKGRVADAPFRKDWPLAMFKRALADAVASGKEWIGWTVGETQNDRFDLSKQVDEIIYYPAQNLLIANQDGDVVVEKDGITPDKLAEVIGKDPAAKIIKKMEAETAQGTAPEDQQISLSGSALKVEGLGMKGFYDTILPKEIGKYVKQWGGKVESGTIGKKKTGTGKLTKDELSEARTDAKRLIRGDIDVEEFNEQWDTDLTYDDIPGPDPYRMTQSVTEILDRVRLQRSLSVGGIYPAWKVAITPAMRASVAGGQSLFSSSSSVSADQAQDATRKPGETGEAYYDRIKRQQVVTFPASRVVYHQTGEKSASAITTGEFKSGAQTGLAEKRGGVYFADRDVNEGVYSRTGEDEAHQGQQPAWLPIDIRGLRLLNTGYTAPDGTWPLHKQYGTAKIRGEFDSLPAGIDGFIDFLNDGRIYEVALPPAVANRARESNRLFSASSAVADPETELRAEQARGQAFAFDMDSAALRGSPTPLAGPVQTSLPFQTTEPPDADQMSLFSGSSMIPTPENPLIGTLKPDTLYIRYNDWSGHSARAMSKAIALRGRSGAAALANFRQTNSVGSFVAFDTDAEGRPNLAHSPNGRTAPALSPDGQYSLGDIDAYKKDRARRIRDNIDPDQAYLEQLQDDLSLALAESRPRTLDEYIEALALSNRGLPVSVSDDRYSSWKELISSLKRHIEFPQIDHAQAIAKAKTYAGNILGEEASAQARELIARAESVQERKAELMRSTKGPSKNRPPRTNLKEGDKVTILKSPKAAEFIEAYDYGFHGGPRARVNFHGRPRTVYLDEIAEHQAAPVQLTLFSSPSTPQPAPAVQARMEFLQRYLDESYETGRTENVDAYEDELETLIEREYSRAIDLEEGGDPYDSAQPSPEEQLVEFWHRWNGQGLANRNQQDILLEDYPTFGDFVRASSPYPIRTGITNRQIEEAARESADAYATRWNRGNANPQDAAYLAAVEAGDMETAQRMVDEAARVAMPESRVRPNANPEVWRPHEHDPALPLIKVYHGGEKGITSFSQVTERPDSGYKQGTLNSQGIWLTESRGEQGEMAEFFASNDASTYADNYGDDGYIYDVYANITNPKRLAHADLMRTTARQLLDQGYDGVYTIDSGFWVALKPEQIKSAEPVTRRPDGSVIPLSQRFNPESPSILFSAASGPKTAAQLDAELFGKIGEDGLRLEQPRASYEDKRQLLLDFSESILGKTAPGGRPSRPDDRRLPGLQVIRERLAADLVADTRVNFLGDTIEGPKDLAVKALALRNPRFETFYLFALKAAENGKDGWQIADVMAISSRVPGSAQITENGKTFLEGLEDHAAFLDKAGAEAYILLHNHPSGDPSPSTADLIVTRKHAAVMAGRGYTFLDHIVINHDKYATIAASEAAAIYDIPPAQAGADRFPWPAKGTGIGEVADSPQEIIRIAQMMEESKNDPSILQVLFLGTRLNVVAMLQGKYSDVAALTQDQLTEYARSQGASYMTASGQADDRQHAEQLAVGLKNRLQSINGDRFLFEASFTYPGGFYSAVESGTLNQFLTPPFFGAANAPGVRVQEETPLSLAAASSRRNALRVRLTREALTDLALQQESWKDWYATHQETLDEFFGDHSQLFQDILAATSQAAEVKSNVALALRAFGQMIRGEDFTGFLPAVIGNLRRVRDQAQLSGQKISTYSKANDGDEGAVVVDRHIARLLFGTTSPSKAQFDKATRILTEIADRLGWEPRQVQASLWAASIVKSGKTPQSYADYLRKLERAGAIRQRIGLLAEGGPGRDGTGGGRGRYSPGGPAATLPSASSARQDAEYLSAVKTGDMTKAQAMVDEAARAAGYTQEGWHGFRSKMEGDRFDPQRFYSGEATAWFGDDSVYLASTEGDARSYAGRKGEVRKFYIPAATRLGFSSTHHGVIGYQPGSGVVAGHHHDFDLTGPMSQPEKDAVNRGDITPELVAKYAPHGAEEFSVADLNQIKSADPVTRDANGNVIPLSQRFNPQSSSTLFSASSLSASVEAALNGMPPIYRAVFTAAMTGNRQTPAQIAAKFSITDKAVTNIVNAVRTRIRALEEAQTAAGLEPAMQGDLLVPGRPDLGMSTIPEVARVDQIRGQEGMPDVEEWDTVIEAAEALLAADYAGTMRLLVERARDNGVFSTTETAAAKLIIARESLQGRDRTPEQRMALTELILAYRETGTEAGRRLAIRRDPYKSPAERHAAFLAEAVNTPDDQTQDAIRRADPARRQKLLQEWAAKVEGMKEALLAEGIDLDASLAEFNARLEAQKAAARQASAEHQRLVAALTAEAERLRGEAAAATGTADALRGQLEAARSEASTAATAASNAQIAALQQQLAAAQQQTAQAQQTAAAAAQRAQQAAALDPGNVIRLELKKLTPAHRAVIETIKTGGTLDQAARIAGTTVDSAERIYVKFIGALEAAMVQAGQLAEGIMLGRNLPSATSLPSANSMRAGAAALRAAMGYPDLAALRQRSAPIDPEHAAAMRRRQPRQATPRAGRTLSAPDMTLDEWAARNRSTMRTLWQTSLDRLLPRQRSQFPPFEEWAKDPVNQQLCRQGELFQRNAFDTLRRLVDNPDRQIYGLLDLNDPLAVKRTAEAIGSIKSKWPDRFLEYWRMSILSGPQTHVVNMGSNVLHSLYDLLPRRVIEAGINGMLGVVGQADPGAATFGEFEPMARNLYAGLARAGRNALESWRIQGRNFAEQAAAQPIEIELNGLKADYIPPAVHGKIGTIMRSISFRAMTAADEFIKSFHGQLEAAAHSHRIAKAEGLTGPAYSARIDELMKEGSKAWLNALDTSNRITFQTKLDKDDPRAIAILDRLAEALKRARRAKHGGKILTFFVPFIDTPTNIAKVAIEMSPVGAMLAVIDGLRALNIRIKKGKISPEVAAIEAQALYNRARFVQDLTNQTIAMAVFWALQGMVEADEDDETGLPMITGTAGFRSTRRGERDTMNRTMPPQTIRIGNLQFTYARVEPFATMLAGTVDLISEIRKSGGLNEKALSGYAGRMVDQTRDKTFLSGIGDILNALEDPDRFLARMGTNTVTGFIPNIIRQPLREIDGSIRDTAPRKDDSMLTALGKGLVYSIAPGSATEAIDVWGNPIPRHRGNDIGGPTGDTLLRIFDPFNVTIAADIDPIDRYMLNWNLRTKDDSDVIGIQAIGNSISATRNGKTVQIPISAEEQAEANRNAGQAARAALGDDWDWQNPSQEGIDQIKRIVQEAQTSERARLRMLKADQMP